MANQIQLGIEVDSSDVKSGEAAFARLTKQLHSTATEMDRLLKSSAGADAEIRRAAKSQGSLDAAGKAAATQVTRLNGALQGTASLARAVQAAFAAFVGAGMVRSLIDTTTQLQKIDQTFLAVTGSSGEAAAQMEYVTQTADKMGQSVLSSATAYSKLLAASQASNIPLETTRSIFEGLTAAATTFNLSQYELEGALNAVQQMISKGTVQAEELRGQLGDRLPGSFAIAAESMGMTVAEFTKQLELGNIASAKFVANFGPALQAKFQGFAESANSSQQQINRLGNAMLELRKAVVEGGFADALANILGTLTGIASSQGAINVANALGAAFKFMAENGEASAIVLGMVAGAFVGLPALIAGAAAALLLFTQRTVAVGAEHVKIGAIISAFWTAIVNSAKAGGELVAAVWDYIAESAQAVPARLEVVWATIKAGFVNMALGLSRVWADFLHGLAGLIPDIPGFEGALLAVNNAAIMAGSSFYALGAAAAAAEANITESKKGLEDAGAAAVKVGEKFAAFQAADANATLAHAAAVAEADRGAENARMEKLDGLKKMKGETDKLTGSTDALATATGKAGGAAKKMADDLAGAKKVMEELRTANQQARDALTGGLTTGRDDAIAEGVQKLQDSLRGTNTSMEQFLKTTGYTREQFEAMLGSTYEMTKQLSSQARLVGSIADGLKSFQTGDLAGGGVSIVQGISDALFGDAMNQAIDDVATKLANAIKDATSKSGLLSGNAKLSAQVGSGIAAAAIGGMNEDAGAVGAGIGQAAGAVLGTVLGGPFGGEIGSVLGALAGGGLAKALSGGSEFKRMSGVAFEGTPYERNVKTGDTLKVGRQDRALEGRFAFLAVQDILTDFQGALTDYVKSTGGTVAVGTRLVVNQTAALKAITGVLDEKGIKASGREGKEAGERIQARVAEIMSIAGLIVQAAAPPLTEAQRLWREAQKKFSDENVAILKDLGLSAAQIAKAQNAVRADIVNTFDREMAGALIDTGRATKEQLDLWKAIELKSLQERKAQSVATAREIGANVDLVMANFAGQRAEIVEKWKEMVDALAPPIQAKITARERWDFSDSILDQLTTINEGAAASRDVIVRWYAVQVAIAKDNRLQLAAEAKRLGMSVLDVNRLYNQQIIDITKQRDNLLLAKAREFAQNQVTAVTVVLGQLNERLKDLESQRSDVLQELTKRANEARQAEEALADARKNLAVSTLAPGGPLDTFRALQAQFNEAITKARGGDAGAASDAARLAQQLLESGRNVFGSSTGYADLFKNVNTALTGVQGVFDKEADRIEAVLDKETFADVTEKSTTALLKALGTIDVTMTRVEQAIDRQTAKLDAAKAKAKVA